MRRRGLWAACVVLLVGVVGVLAVGTGFAKDEDAEAKCSEATLEGTYLFANDGVEIRGNNQLPFAVAGREVRDGKGNIKGVASSNFNREVFRNEPFSGTYTVNADCTGTNTYTDGTHYDMFIAPDGSEFTVVQTHPKKFVTSWTTKRVED
jgi:hypothetical protein